MKKLLPVAFCLIIHFAARAQSVFPPVGSTWSYNWTAHNGGYNGPATHYYTGDTVVSGITYKKIAKAWNYTIMGPYPPDIGSSCCRYIVERNDSIFDAQYTTGGAMQLLYVFNQPAGDSIIFNAGMGSLQYKIVFDSLKTQFICNQNRRVLYYTKYENGCTDSVRIIEGIGPVNDYLFSQGIEACELGPGLYTFTCADITTCIYPGGSCYKEPLSIKNVHQPGVTCIQRGDAYEIIFSEPLSGELSISDMQGREVHRGKLNSSERLLFHAGFSKGIYLVQVNSTMGNIRKKIVIN